jgi:hypothetical protein
VGAVEGVDGSGWAECLVGVYLELWLELWLLVLIAVGI